MPKRGEWLQKQTPEQRQKIAASGGVERAKNLSKKRRLEISRMGSRVWSAQQKAKKQALSKP